MSTASRRGLILSAILVATFCLLISQRERFFGAKPDGLLGRALRVGVVSWPGYAAGIVANNGFEANRECIFWKQHRLLVEFVLYEDVEERTRAFVRGPEGDVDIVWSTVDFLANEWQELKARGVQARAIMQADWSRGGDAIVADVGVRRVEELRGKRVALARFTPSEWLLEHTLKESSLTPDQQSEIVRRVVGKRSSPEARSDFVAKKVDVAVMWEPDVAEALANRPGAHVLASTRTAHNLIADVMIARDTFIKRHPDVIRAFVAGWVVDGTEAANRALETAVRLLVENEPLYQEPKLGPDRARAGLTSVRFADLSDNIAMFGLDGQPPIFDRLFAEASKKWFMPGSVKRAADPKQAKDDRFVRELYRRFRR